MTTFIRRPLEVEAHQWWSPGHEKHDPSMFSADGSYRDGPRPAPGKVFLSVKANPAKGTPDFYAAAQTAMSYTRVIDGDWVVKDPNGNISVMGAAAFDTLFEEKHQRPGALRHR